MTIDQLWPQYCGPSDLAAIESIPLEDRGLPESTYAILSRAAALWPDGVATTVIGDHTHYERAALRTFAELLADVHQQANLLYSMGVRRRHAVGLLSPNCDELIAATLAAQLAGMAAPVNGALAPRHIADLLGRTATRVVVVAAPEFDQKSWQVMESMAADGLIDTVLLVRPTAMPGNPPLPSLPGVTVGYLRDLARDMPADRFLGTPPLRDDLAALFHTGGTTGAPKVAAHTHGNEVSDAWMIAANSTLGADATVLAALPLFHVNAAVVTVLAPLLRGQRVVWAGPLGYRDPVLYAHFWKIIQHFGVTAMSAVPTVYSVLSTLHLDADISSLRYAVVGASALPQSVRQAFEAHTGVDLVEGYGLTEATCASARSFAEHRRPGSVGQRMPYQHIKAVRIDEHGRWHELAPGTVGTLVIKGPNVFPGYVEAVTAEEVILSAGGKVVDGWLDTGDLGCVDADGFVSLAGRSKDLIIRGGHNIDPAVIENALLAHPDVRGAAAVGRPDPHAGEVPIAFVTLRDGAQSSAEHLRAWAAERVGEPAAIPKDVVVVDELPVTAVGKPYKVPLRAMAARDAVVDALAGLDGICGIDAEVDDGVLTVAVVIDGDADEETIRLHAGRLAIATRIEVAGHSAHS